MMKIALVILGVLLAAVLVVVLIGWRLPVAHVATASVQVPAPAETVFALIATPEQYATWRSDVKKVEVTAESGVTRFREDGSNGPIRFEITERVPPRRFVTKIADPSLPFGGRWVYEITPTSTGSELRITEEGEVYNPLFRFMSKYVFGHTATLDAYLAAVRKRFAKG